MKPDAPCTHTLLQAAIALAAEVFTTPPPPSRHFVGKVFTGVLLAEKGGLPYYPNAGLLARERVFKVSDGSEEAGIIIAVVEAGAGITEATALVNEHRASRAAGPDADPISWNAVRNWIAANPAITGARRRRAARMTWARGWCATRPTVGCSRQKCRSRP